MLSKDSRLKTEEGQPLRVLEYLGAGGQGEVYAVELSGQSYALKWYFPPHDTLQVQADEQRKALRTSLVAKTPPDPRFLWPMAYVEDTVGQSFGYLMELRNPRFKEFTKLVCDTLQPRPDYRVMCTAAIGVADCFRNLHVSGLAYKDINLGGPFLDPRTGEVLICDCDNVRVNNTPGTIMFLSFAAPEVVVGKSSCTNRTDDHSLAVLMFYMFVRDHPLEGELEANLNAFNDAAKRKLYGESPVFIFDPTNNSNRPVRGIHNAAIHNWPRMPKFVQDAFIRAFTEGLHNPNRRLIDNEWISLFSKLRDGLFTCPSCTKETFYDQEVINRGRTLECVWCRSRLQTPMRLTVGSEVLSISPEMCIYPHHLGEFYNFSAPAAKMSRHPENPNRWGIKNLTESKWTFSGADGSLKEVPPGRSVPLRNNLEVNFGTAKGIVQH